jgi:hypothetical protein
MKLLSLFENAEQFDEVQLDQHSYERSLERFLKKEVFPLMLKTKNSGPRDYVKVGNYFLSAEERAQILEKVNDVFQFQLPVGKIYGVEFHRFDVFSDKNVMYPNKDLKLQTLNEVVRRDGRLYLADKSEGEPTIGDTLFGIIRDNTIKTFYLNRSHTMSAQKHNVDDIISSDMVAIISGFKKEKGPWKFN